MNVNVNVSVNMTMTVSPTGNQSDEIVAALRDAVGAAGLDIVEPLRVGWYNQVVAARHRLEDHGDPAALAVLIGNSRALWDRFVGWLRAHPGWLEEPDPLDRYVTMAVEEALARVPLGSSAAVRYAHRPEPAHVAMQKLAQVAGVARLAPSYLCVHPRYGPWIALRAVAIFPVVGPLAPAAALPPACACAEQCVPPLEAALAAGADPEAAWPDWLAVRDACPRGQEHRYGEDQLRYHYSKDVGILRALLTA